MIFLVLHIFAYLIGVEPSLQTWVHLNGCDQTPLTELISQDDDEMKVTRKTYQDGKDRSEVALIAIEGGGHTWPGKKSPISLIGKSTPSISANDLMWEFFQKHAMK